MAQFPIILIPDAIQQTRTALPPVPPPPNLPVADHPGDPPSKINMTLIASLSAIACVLSLIIGNMVDSTVIGTLLLIGSLSAVAFRAWQSIKNFPKRKKKHQEQLAIFRRTKEDNEQQKLLHYKRVEAAKTPEKIAKFRDELLLDVLSRTIPHDGNKSQARIGYSEKYFHSYLTKYFGNNIYTGLTLSIPDFAYPYSPDFAYIDSNINLYIDIEIDEPYAHKSGQATHYLYSRKDKRRNYFFLGRGWLVIRLSEEQIVKLPESCCKTVAETIANLLGDDLILNQFRHIPSLPQMKQWTENEAKDMALTKYRNTYL